MSFMSRSPGRYSGRFVLVRTFRLELLVVVPQGLYGFEPTTLYRVSTSRGKTSVLAPKLFFNFGRENYGDRSCSAHTHGINEM